MEQGHPRGQDVAQEGGRRHSDQKLGENVSRSHHYPTDRGTRPRRLKQAREILWKGHPQQNL